MLLHFFLIDVLLVDARIRGFIINPFCVFSWLMSMPEKLTSGNCLHIPVNMVITNCPLRLMLLEILILGVE